MEQDSILAKAEYDLEKAQSRVGKLRDDLARAEDQVQQMASVVSWLRKQAGLPDTDPNQTTRAHPKTRPNSKSGELVEICIAAIKSMGRRLSIQELETAIIVEGREIGGANPRTNLAGYLSRDDRIEYQQGRGWGLVNETPAEAGVTDNGSVAERSIAPDSKSGEPSSSKNSMGSGSSNLPASAPNPTRKLDLLGSSSLGSLPPDPRMRR